VYGAVAGAGGAIGLLLGGLVTQYLSWRWCLYVNLIFAGIAVAGARPAAPPAERRRPQAGPARCRARVGRHVLHGVRVLQGRAARLAFRVVLGFPGRWQRRADRVRLVADQDRASAAAAADRGRPTRAGRLPGDTDRGIGLFGTFLLVSNYLQQMLGFSPVCTGLAFLPMITCFVQFTNVSNLALRPHTGPRPLVPAGLLVAAAGLAVLTRISVHSSYASGVLPSLLMVGAGFGSAMAPVFNTGTFGVQPQDAGVASVTVNTGQQLGGSIGPRF
jgi:MFS family permease